MTLGGLSEYPSDGAESSREAAARLRNLEAGVDRAHDARIASQNPGIVMDEVLRERAERRKLDGEGALTREESAAAARAALEANPRRPMSDRPEPDCGVCPKCGSPGTDDTDAIDWDVLYGHSTCTEPGCTSYGRNLPVSEGER